MINWLAIKKAADSIVDSLKGAASNLMGERQSKLKDFHPQPIVTDPSLQFPRKNDAISNMGKAATYMTTSYPAETYGHYDKPGDFVVAFGGAGSGVGSQHEEYLRNALNKRYGEGNYALFAPTQVNQAAKFVQSLPKGSNVHLTGWSQGGGSTVELLKRMRDGKWPNVHSVHLYDAVSNDPKNFPDLSDVPYADKITHFMPSLIVPYVWDSDGLATVGGHLTDIKGARNIRLPYNHHDIVAHGQQVNPSRRLSVTGRLSFPLKDRNVRDLSTFDLTATVPANGRPSFVDKPESSIRRLYDPVSNSYGAGRNNVGQGGIATPGMGVTPRMDIANPPAWTKVSPSYTGGRKYSNFYKDSNIDKVINMAASGDIRGVSGDTEQFLQFLKPITDKNNPMGLKLWATGSIADQENSIRLKMEGQIKNWLQSQAGRDAVFGYSGLFSTIQKDLNRLYKMGQMEMLKGDKATGRAYARTAYLGSQILEDVIQTTKGEYNFDMPIGMLNRSVVELDPVTKQRIAATTAVEQAKRRAKAIPVNRPFMQYVNNPGR